MNHLDAVVLNVVARRFTNRWLIQFAATNASDPFSSDTQWFQPMAWIQDGVTLRGVAEALREFADLIEKGPTP